MKAAQIVAPRRVEVVDVEEPSLVDAPPGMIKIRVERTCLCGSDMPLFTYDLAELQQLAIQGQRSNVPFLDVNRGHVYPLRPGQAAHECVGTVVESTSSRFREDDFVLAVPDAQAGLCQYFCAPEGRAIHLPGNGIAKEHILMTQPLGTVIWACQKLGNLLNLDTVVVGQGPMGLLMTHLVSNMGARTVIGMDKLDYRLEAARKMRATHTVNVDREDAVAAVKEITGGKMADVVFEVVGHQTATIEFCMNLLRRRGAMVAFGVPDERFYSGFPFSDFIRQNLTLIGSIGPDIVPNYSLARDMIVQGRIDVSHIITHILPLQEIQKASDLFADRKDGAIKVVLNHETLS